MKILFISNFYPPFHIGGYEMLCQEVAEGLAARSHDICILTSTHGIGRESIDGPVHRLLELESDLDFYSLKKALSYPAASGRNIRHLETLCDRFAPDILFVWGMWSLSKEVAAAVERRYPSRVVYYMANPWPIEANLHRAYWEGRATRPWRQVIKSGLRPLARRYLHREWSPPALQMAHAPCCSAALRDQLLDHGVSLPDAPIIYEGIDLSPYLAQADRRQVRPAGEPLRLLYVGILAPHKGVHTNIEALHALAPAEREQVCLTILGKGHPQYVGQLHQLVDSLRLGDSVTFQDPIPRADLPAFLGRHDVLLLSSIWEEPMAPIMQEGLAAGMVVIGTATGGTKEIIVDGENGYLFAPGDAGGLAGHLRTLLANPAAAGAVGRAARNTAAALFDIERMVGDLEAYLLQVQTQDPRP